MRVAVKHPARTEPDGTDVPESISAYAQGRIEGFTHPLTGVFTPAEEVAEALLKRAKEEFPKCEVFIERLVHNGDAPPVQTGDGETIEDPHGEGGSSRWVREEEVPEGAVSPKGGRIAARELSVTQEQSTGGES